jgi:hypothetical protein
MLHIIYNSKENDAICGFSVIEKADLSSWGYEKTQRLGGSRCVFNIKCNTVKRDKQDNYQKGYR